MKKNIYKVDNHNDKWCIREREHRTGLLFTGTLPECYAWIKLMEGGYF